jgi:hypothetical protein
MLFHESIGPNPKIARMFVAARWNSDVPTWFGRMRARPCAAA